MRTTCDRGIECAADALYSVCGRTRDGIEDGRLELYVVLVRGWQEEADGRGLR